MIHFRGIASQIIVLFLVTGLSAVVAVPKKPPVQQNAAPMMSVCQARRAVLEELQQAFICHSGTCHGFLSPLSDISFNATELEFLAAPGDFKKEFPNGTYRIDLKALGVITFNGRGNWNGVDPVLINGELPLSKKNRSSKDSVLGFLDWLTPNNQFNSNAGEAFADAINVLRLYARAFDSSTGLSPPCFADKDEQARIWVEFQKRVAAWHSLPARPPLFDAVRKQQLLAEDAVNQKQFEAAAAAYDAGTQIDPTWPEGHFNAAAIYGELKDYDDAVWHMRCYLELMPNAPDAQAARDQMLLWQAKAEQQTASQ